MESAALRAEDRQNKIIGPESGSRLRKGLRLVAHSVRRTDPRRKIPKTKRLGPIRGNPAVSIPTSTGISIDTRMTTSSIHSGRNTEIPRRPTAQHSATIQCKTPNRDDISRAAHKIHREMNSTVWLEWGFNL